MRLIGNFHHIREKLEGLATGDWVQRSLAKPVSPPSINFKVRIFEAIYGTNGRILWQVDEGFDQGMNMQIVRSKLPPHQGPWGVKTLISWCLCKSQYGELVM